MELSKYVLSKHINYTSDQERAIEKILSWVEGGKETCFSLRGVGGSGKTTVLAEIVRNMKGAVACSAPTHKAVRIIAKQIKGSPCTIHKLLGLYPNTNLESFDHLNPKFDPRGKKYIADYKLVIVDEASMIPLSIDSMLSNEARNNGVKVLYVGDPYQLPPIKEDGSFNTIMPFLRYNYVELTQIVRQDSDNPILKLLSIARNDVRYKSNKALNYINSNNNTFIDGKGFLATRDIHHFTELMIDKFSDASYFKDIDFCRYLAFTNDNINSYNTFIRNSIIPNANDAILVKDDLLLSHTTILDEFSSLLLINSDNYIISKITNFTRNGIDGFLVKLVSLDTGDDTKMFFIVDHSNPDSITNYYNKHNSYLNAAKFSKNNVARAENWKKFYSFKGDNLLMTKLEQGSNLISKMDIAYGHGMTIHKSQGSTYNNVFVNLRDVVYTSTGMPYSNIDLRNRLIYVALSRCKDASFIYY